MKKRNHLPSCKINQACGVYHADGICPGPYGTCTCHSQDSKVRITGSNPDGTMNFENVISTEKDPVETPCDLCSECGKVVCVCKAEEIIFNSEPPVCLKCGYPTYPSCLCAKRKTEKDPVERCMDKCNPRCCSIYGNAKCKNCSENVQSWGERLGEIVKNQDLTILKQFISTLLAKQKHDYEILLNTTLETKNQELAQAQEKLKKEIQDIIIRGDKTVAEKFELIKKWAGIEFSS